MGLVGLKTFPMPTAKANVPPYGCQAPQCLRAKARVDLQEFYTKNPLPLPERPNWRFWRFFPFEGYPYQLKDTVRNTETLQKFLIRDPPLHLYHSVCMFLNAMNVGPNELIRAGFPISYNLFLEPSGAIDVDVHESPVESGVDRSLKIAEFLEQEGFSSIRSTFTGRGFHLFFKSDDRDITENPDVSPVRRMELYRAKRTVLAQRLVEKHLISKRDMDITCDPKRIIRAVGSVHGKSGYVVTEISIDSLPSFRLDDIQRIESVALLAQESQKKGDEKFDVTKSVKDMGVSCSMPMSDRPPPAGICLFSRVMGVKNRHVFMARFDQKEEGKLPQRLNRLIERHGFPDIYTFRFFKWTFALSLIALESNQLLKILVREKMPVNATFLSKYRQLFVVLGGWKRFFAPTTNCRSALVSRGHLNFLKGYGVRTFPHTKLCGQDDVVLKEGQVTDQHDI